MADVFLSYKRDDKQRARSIADAIEAHGFSVFYDAEIDVGESWNRRIETEINASKCVAVLWSEHSCDTRNGEWVHNEARLGKQRDILAPALIGDCGIPLEFSSVQAADLRAWRGDPADEQWRNFIERIGACVKQQPKNLGARPWRRRWVRIAAAVLVVGAVVGGVGYYAWRYQNTHVAQAPAAPPPPSVPSELAQRSLGPEWEGYRSSGNCAAMVSWSAQYFQEYPDWDLARVAHDQTGRMCPGQTVAAATQVLANAAPTAADAGLNADLIAGLRATNPAPLTDAQIAAGAARLGVAPAAIQAIMLIQSGAATGFTSDGHPTINFEHQVFSRLTGHRFDDRASGVSSRSFVPGTYARPQAQRWQLLEEAYGLDRTAALSATGWGRFRILGMNYAACGFSSLDAFVQAQAQSEEAQLAAFEAFVRAQGLIDSLHAKDWRTFAQRFYGSATFAGDLERAYRRFGGT